ncbi:MAG: redoxin domain-containing protein [Fimbriimonadales bacterium]|nr:redoxin domain-containing protein [Fimbriimonadales bacterium]
MMRWSVATLCLSGLLFWAGWQPESTPSPVQWTTLDGKTVRLGELQGAKATVIVTLSTRCPAVPRYAPRLNALYETYRKQGVAFYGIYPEADETVEAVREHAQRLGLKFPVARQGAVALARHLGATHVPQAFVLNRKGEIVYAGAIDSVIKREVAQHHYLRDAIRAVLAGKPVPKPRTAVVGCFLSLPETDAEALPAQVTYAEHIAPILYAKCTTCHHPGDIGPFPLQSYNDAKRWAKEIKYYTQKRLMPPWKPTPGFAKFKDEFYLTDEEIALIARWVDSGAPAGDLSKAPKPPTFNKGWYYGEPDLIVEMPEEYVLEGTGGDEYRYFVIPVELPENKVIVGIDIQPGNREVVHHANMFVDISGRARQLDAQDPGPGYSNFGGTGFVPIMMLGGWVPGMRPIRLEGGYAAVLPRKFDLVMQVHYFKRGKREKDRTKVGLYLADRTEKTKPVQLAVIGNRNINIPPGEKNYRVYARWTTPSDRPVYALSIMAHMHLIARGTEVVAKTPDGRTIPLLQIKDYDFNWQQAYFYEKPIELPPGTVIECVGWYDNSSDNPSNPSNPPRLVRYGEGTYDEMFYIFLAVHDPKAKSSYLIPASL